MILRTEDIARGLLQSQRDIDNSLQYHLHTTTFRRSRVSTRKAGGLGAMTSANTTSTSCPGAQVDRSLHATSPFQSLFTDLQFCSVITTLCQSRYERSESFLARHSGEALKRAESWRASCDCLYATIAALSTTQTLASYPLSSPVTK